MFKKPGDIWPEECWSFDTPSRKYYIIKEMTGAGSFEWGGIFDTEESAIKEIDSYRRRVNYGRH